MANLTLEIDGHPAVSGIGLGHIRNGIASVAAGDGEFLVVTDENADHTFAQTACSGDPDDEWTFEHFNRGVGYQRMVPQAQVIELFEEWIDRGPNWGTDGSWECLGDFS